MPDSRDNTGEKADDRTQDERDAGKDEGGAETLEDFVQHGSVQRIGSAEITLQHIADPDQVLLNQRLIETEVSIDSLDVFRRRIGAENGGRRIPGNEGHHQEDDDRQAEQHGHDRDQTFENIGRHGNLQERPRLTSASGVPAGISRRRITASSHRAG